MGRTRAVPGGSGGGIPGNGGCTGLAFWRFFPGLGLAIHRHAPSLAQSRERTLRATLRPPAPSSSSCAFLPQPLVRHPTHGDSLVGAPASYLVNSRIFDQLKASVG